MSRSYGITTRKCAFSKLLQLSDYPPDIRSFAYIYTANRRQECRKYVFLTNARLYLSLKFGYFWRILWQLYLISYLSHSLQNQLIKWRKVSYLSTKGEYISPHQSFRTSRKILCPNLRQPPVWVRQYVTQVTCVKHQAVLAILVPFRAGGKLSLQVTSSQREYPTPPRIFACIILNCETSWFKVWDETKCIQ
jgi:hypothetical protein